MWRGGLLYSACVAVVSRLPWNPYGAVFRVVGIDEHADMGEHGADDLGRFVFNAVRTARSFSERGRRAATLPTARRSFQVS